MSSSFAETSLFGVDDPRRCGIGRHQGRCTDEVMCVGSSAIRCPLSTVLCGADGSRYGTYPCAYVRHVRLPGACVRFVIAHYRAIACI